MAACAQSSSRALSGRRVVVTRPAHQADALCAAITAAGGEAVLFPLLSIRAVNAKDHAHLLSVLRRLLAGEFDLVMLVSPNAIEQTFSALAQTGQTWPASLPVAVVGKGSEAALAARGVLRERIISPGERFDSEGLLAMPALQSVRGWRVLILRGDGGRELVATTLRERGATVEAVTCYHRDAPDADAARIRLQALWQKGIDAFTLTSSEGLRHLYALLDDAGKQRLQTIPLFVPHSRIADEARHLGLSRIIPTLPGDAGLMSGLIACFSAAEPPFSEQAARVSHEH